jgi:cyclohexanone monooxygenase
VSDEELDRVLSERWAKGGLLFLGGFNDSMVNKASNDRVANWVRNKISSIVRDPRTAKLLQPDTVIGCKRLVVDSGYYDTFNRPNVSLVNVSDQPIERFTEDGIIVGGTEHPVDIVVLATGFDAMTGSLLKLGITGRNGTSLADAWSAGPVNYLGLTVHGFPNFFMITGPGSPSVLTNVLVSIQHHVEWITATISHLTAHGHSRIEATQEAQESWVSHVNGVASMTLFPSCNSWYLGANIPGKPRIFMPLPGFPDYVSRVSRATEAHYEGFALTN